jgi:hypothetical protein
MPTSQTESIPEQQDSQETAPKTLQDETPEEIQNALKELCRKFASRDKWIRRWQVRKAAKARFFWRGHQRLVFDSRFGMELPYQGGFGSSDDEGDEGPQYLDTTNIYQGYARKVMAALTQEAPSVRFEPVDPASAIDIQDAAAKEDLRPIIEKNNNMDVLQIDMARLLWTDGPVYGYTYFERDENRFGTEVDPSTGEKIPAGQEIIEFYGVLEGKGPMTIKSFHKWPYFNLSMEIDIVTAKDKYEDVAEKIIIGASGASEDQYERIARMSVMQGTEVLTQSGDSLTHLVTWQRTWFRPEAFWEVDDEDLRKQMIELYPSGAHVVFMGDTFCEARDENVDDHITLIRPLPGDGNDTPALGDIEISVQERFNDLMDIQMEGHEMGQPGTWFDQKTIDIKAMKEQRSLPTSKYPCNNPVPGQPLANQFFTEAPFSVSPDLIKFCDDLRGPISEFLCDAPPAMFGAEMPDNTTASGYAMARDQAMGAQGTVWRNIKMGYANIMNQAVMCAKENRINDISSGSGTNAVTVSIADLKGNSRCWPDTSEGFPETYPQRSAKFMQVATLGLKNPAIAAILQNPRNQTLAHKMIGLQDLEIPGSDSSKKQIWEIQQLLQGQPVPVMGPAINPITGQPILDPQTGQPGQVQQKDPQTGQPKFESSVPIDAQYDNHEMEFQEVVDFVNSEKGRVAKLTKPEGFENVRLHGLEHQAVLQANAKPAPPKPPSVSIQMKDLTPEGQVQAAAEAGIQESPAELQAKAALDMAQKMKPKAPPPNGAPVGPVQ